MDPGFIASSDGFAKLEEIDVNSDKKTSSTSAVRTLNRVPRTLSISSHLTRASHNDGMSQAHVYVYPTMGDQASVCI